VRDVEHNLYFPPTREAHQGTLQRIALGWGGGLVWEILLSQADSRHGGRLPPSNGEKEAARERP
jgi:hypothetical protein